jgi:hypothetical protein
MYLHGRADSFQGGSLTFDISLQLLDSITIVLDVQFITLVNMYDNEWRRVLCMTCNEHVPIPASA